MSRAIRIATAALDGAAAEPVTVEAHFEAAPDTRKRTRTDILLTGLPDPVLRESRGRLLSALAANRLQLGAGRLHLNLVPAARPKSGAMLDLALCLAATAAGAHLDPRVLRDTMFLGEVGLDGTLHEVPGGLAAALAAREAGLARVVAPWRTAREAAFVEELEVHHAASLAQVVRHFSPGAEPLPRTAPPEPPGGPRAARPMLEVRGQAAAKRAAVVAAAGGHALLMVGPPGVGKTMIARRLVHLLPAPDRAEQLAITRVLSAIGRWPEELAHERPFRAPHHTASYAGLVGGGSPPMPGEITLAHEGVLFLDELPEFQREVLEALRQPLESGTIAISRAGYQSVLPARFRLVAAMNPCPCGYLGAEQRACRCSPHAVARYRARLSGPLLDRFELRIALSPPSARDLVERRAADREGPEECALVRRATDFRRARGQAVPNAELDGDELDRVASAGGEGGALLVRAAQQRGLSGRAISGLRRVARTLADLEEREEIATPDWMEALALRGGLA